MPESAEQVVPQERRTSPRKALRRRISLDFLEGRKLNGQTVDISSGGLRITIDRSLPVPQECAFEFTAIFDGKMQTLAGRGRILSCVCTGMHGFSIGMQFLDLNATAKAVIAGYIR